MLKVISIVKTILKYGGVVMAIIKAFEVLSDELEKNNKNKSDEK